MSYGEIPIHKAIIRRHQKIIDYLMLKSGMWIYDEILIHSSFYDDEDF